MDNSHLSRLFPLDLESSDVQTAYLDLRAAGRALAETINKLVPESPTKVDITMRLFRVVADAELAIRLDGLNNLQQMILTKH